jgi:protein-tyrosine-phosphatase
MKKVLFICTGNTCRSPMCEAYFKTLGGEIEAASAGLYAYDGDTASAHAREVVAEFGGDLSAFRSRKLTPFMLAEADMVVAMGSGHRSGVLELMPEADPKTILLLGSRDVGDPFGGPLAVYRRCFEEMKTALDKLYKTLT